MKKYFYSLPLLALLSLASCSSDDDAVVVTTDPDDVVLLADETPSAPIIPDGFYVVNEDWFGHDEGTVNFFKNDGSILYRAYRNANKGEILGRTTAYATIYGDNVYFVSKQQNRFVVADAKTFKKKAVLTDIGGDGRSFVGVNAKKGYIATANGITVFNIETMTVNGSISGVSGQTGNMLLVGDYVIAITQSKGAYVIDTKTDTVKKLIGGTDIVGVTQSKDGSVWIGATNRLIKLNQFSLENVEEINISEAPIKGSWGAWNPGSLTVSAKENALYWTTGKSVVKYNIDTKNLNNAFYTLGKDDQDKQLAFYGGALRIDPITDKLIVLVKRDGWGDAGSYNWLHIVNNTGMLEKNIVVAGDNGLGGAWGTADDRYFWFPSIPFFQDVNSPEILLNQVVLKPNERKAIALNNKISDADNISSSIIKSISFKNNNVADYQIKQDSLIVVAKASIGKDRIKIHVNSNGKQVEKEIRIDVRK